MDYLIPILAAGLLGGASAGLAGVYIVGMRMPFVGVCIAHAAMAGAVWARLFGLPELPSALGLAVLTSASLALVGRGRIRLDTGVALGVLFSLMMGLVFLGIGLSPGAKGPLLGLLWGSLVFVGWREVAWIAATSGALFAFVALFSKEMCAILFSRTLAAATGLRERLVLSAFLVLCGATLTVNLNTVGGLMIYSLISVPAAAAFQVARGYAATALCSAGLGAACAVGGFGIAYGLREWEVPVGACIVIVSVGVFFGAVGVRRWALRDT
jgi:manganese/iron transport system permease protein